MSPRDQGWEILMAQSQAQMTQAVAAGMSHANPTMSLPDLIAAVTAAVLAAQQANLTPKQAVEKVQDEAPRMVVCSACNEEVKAAGIGLHKSRWCKTLHPKAEVAG
jgi:hypothetical protein